MTQFSLLDFDAVPAPPPTPSRKRGRPVEVEGWADKVVQHIPSESDFDEWIHADDLAQLTHLTLPQVYRAIGYLRDEYPEWALVSHVSKGYRFSIKEEEVSTFRKSRGRTMTTMMRRTWSGVIEPFLTQGGASTREVAKLKRRWDNLLAEIMDEVAV